MKKPRRAFSYLVLAAAFTIAAAFAAPNINLEKKAKVGEEAPNFTLKDIDGKEHSLKDFKDKLVVLQWINYGCPVCRRVMKTLEKDMIDDLKELDKDIVILGINSTKNLTIENTAKYLEKNKIKGMTALLDKDGTVGKLYGAKTTPHMYVIDTKGVLRYAGAFDDDQSGRKGDDATNYTINAVKQILEGETVAPDQTRSYGCAVKYAN